jgi:hypothetical protein
MSKHAAEAAPEVSPLAEQLINAQIELTLHRPAEEGLTPTLTPEDQAACNEVANGIFDSLGIPRDEALEPGESGLGWNSRIPVPMQRVRRAADVATAAIELGFDRDAPNEALQDVATTLIDRIHELRGRANKDHHYKDSGEYTKARRPLDLLLQSAVSELGRRHDLGDDLSIRNIQAIQEATGLRLVQSEPWEDVFRSIITRGRRYDNSTGGHHKEHIPIRPGRATASTPARPSEPAYPPAYVRVRSSDGWSYAVQARGPGYYVVHDADGSGRLGRLRV